MASINKPKPSNFAGRIQLLLILLLPVCFLMIIQQSDRAIYRWGILFLIVLTLFQIAFGNIPAHFNWKKTLISVVVAALIIGGIVFLSINLVPTLIRIGQ
jgi:hypothetical protein